jgi:cysteinyl-tRNA synthetase
MSGLKLYNSISREIEPFEPINPCFVGVYICGPTVYAEPHLGHVRGPVVFDIMHRYLIHKGYKVRFVRNITDVGHLVNDADEGEDKLAAKAKLEQLEPMEIAQKYTSSYLDMLNAINVLPASIEPRASGHIIEQIEMISEIINAGLAYEVNGSVYFDVKGYAANNDYGKLSGRKLDELIAGAGGEARTLSGQEEKRNPEDFALWKKAGKEHIMQWTSPWGKGFPGWHIECSAMSRKYLGDQFDIHGGGMDLLFPHHESEIAQSTACTGNNPAKFWIHHNMVTINGQKMAKSLGNGISIKELFSGDHLLLDKAYNANVIKFFILQAHYRGTLDFSNEALQASEKGLNRLLTAIKTAEKIAVGDTSSIQIDTELDGFISALDDDLNTPIAISKLFDLAKKVNQLVANEGTLTQADKDALNSRFKLYAFNILGLAAEENQDENQQKALIQMILEMRKGAKENKNYALSDKIRDELAKIGLKINDGKDGATVGKI